jgi:hypothetical protein
VSRSIVRLLKGAEVDFGILGNDESRCGSEARAWARWAFSR